MRRVMCLPIALLLATALPATATAQTRAMHRYRSVIQTTTLSTANGYPAVGGTAVSIGTLHTTSGGDGALIDRIAITGHPAPNAFDLTGSEVAYLDHGSVRDTFTGTVTVQSDGSQHITATGVVHGGTGRYAGATGYYIYNGTITAGSTVITGGSIGWVTY